MVLNNLLNKEPIFFVILRFESILVLFIKRYVYMFQIKEVDNVNISWIIEKQSILNISLFKFPKVNTTLILRSGNCYQI